jgi:hypothetical protein
MTDKKPVHVVTDPEPATAISEEAASIPKPGPLCLSAFRSTRATTIASVEALQTALPHHKISEARDFVRLHPDKANFWSSELCFVSVPIQGQRRDTLHLIREDLAVQYLPSGRIQRFRLTLATKPHDIFFLCHVPTQNEDNMWNATNLQACEQAKTKWTMVSSRKGEGVEGYKIDFAKDADAFPPPKWPTQSLENLILITFTDRMITDEKHPALLRLLGARQLAT